MIKTEIEKAIKYQGEIEIEYRNLERNTSVRHIFDMNYSNKYGNNYIEAYCRESEGYLTFRIDRIISVKWIWIEIYDIDDTAPKTGLYVFACRYDNHIELEIYRLNEREKLWKYFTEEYEHHDGYFEVTPLAYHYIDFYSEKSICHWKIQHPFMEEYSNDKIKIWAYSKNENNIEYALQYFSSSIWPEHSFLNNTYYDEDFWNNVNFVGYRTFPRYTETHHAAHWRAKNKLSNRSSTKK